MTVAPATCLNGGTVVTVTGSGFDAGAVAPSFSATATLVSPQVALTIGTAISQKVPFRCTGASTAPDVLITVERRHDLGFVHDHGGHGRSALRCPGTCSPPAQARTAVAETRRLTLPTTRARPRRLRSPLATPARLSFGDSAANNATQTVPIAFVPAPDAWFRCHHDDHDRSSSNSGGHRRPNGCSDQGCDLGEHLGLHRRRTGHLVHALGRPSAARPGILDPDALLPATRDGRDSHPGRAQDLRGQVALITPSLRVVGCAFSGQPTTPTSEFDFGAKCAPPTGSRSARRRVNTESVTPKERVPHSAASDVPPDGGTELPTW